MANNKTYEFNWNSLKIPKGESEAAVRSRTYHILAKRTNNDLHTKQCTEHKIAEDDHPPKNRGWTRVFRYSEQFLLLVWHPSCYLCSVGAPSTISVPPLILRIVHRFKGEDSNIGIDGARGASHHLFVYVICVWFSWNKVEKNNKVCIFFWFVGILSWFTI
jgi:hypothetical protein